MAPPKPTSSRHTSNTLKKDKKKPAAAAAPRRPATTTTKKEKDQSKSSPKEEKEGIDLSTTIPLTLQQLLLNVFKTGLLSADGSGLNLPKHSREGEGEEAPDLKTLVQTIKAHLYRRDFDSAFTDASEDLLCAYALRWSASRALGYAGVLRGVLMELVSETRTNTNTNHVVCIGGGAGAEIVALAAVWRDLMGMTVLEDGLKGVSLEETSTSTSTPGGSDTTATETEKPRLTITAVDIADWSRVVDRLSTAIQSPHVPGGKTHPAPLLQADSDTGSGSSSSGFAVRFQRADILSVPDDEFKTLLHFHDTPATLVTLMFTLNELFSTSMAKATGFLLRMTDLLDPGTLLLVVDSPGSYSTVKLGKGDEQRERQYPMKFLLDHALLSVATGRWEKLLSQDSRWWRRDAPRLGYDVGEGAGLEDMRFQIHVYRRRV